MQSDSIAKNMKIKYGKLKEEEKKSPQKERAAAKIPEKPAKDEKNIKDFASDKIRDGFCKNLLSILASEAQNFSQKVEESALKALVIEIDEGIYKLRLFF